MEKAIREKLCEIEREQNVRILYAAESGSRAWGFASPDSDYDVRFIYVRPMDAYLRLNPYRDVIEWQMDAVFDMNGWDLSKALIHFQKGNSTLFEWAASPLVYRTSGVWESVYSAARAYFSVKAAVYHYYGTANHTYCQYLQEEQVRYKKYFYALRPLLAARYIEERRCPPPVLFEQLMEQELPDALRQEIQRVMEIKMRSGEGDVYPRSPILQTFLEGELIRQKELADRLPDDRKEDWGPLNQVFLQTLRREEVSWDSGCGEKKGK